METILPIQTIQLKIKLMTKIHLIQTIQLKIRQAIHQLMELPILPKMEAQFSKETSPLLFLLQQVLL